MGSLAGAFDGDAHTCAGLGSPQGSEAVVQKRPTLGCTAALWHPLAQVRGKEACAVSGPEVHGSVFKDGF